MKNKILKRRANNFLFNIKLLIINDKNNKIKEGYYSNHKKFIDYFVKQYFKTKPFKDKKWNYSNYLKSDEVIQKYFNAINVLESLNRTLKSFYEYSKKIFIIFKFVIIK